MDNINVVVEANNARKGYTQTYETIVLKPNVHDGVNVLTEEMFTKENAKYVIKWDYDLEGASITIPENCIISMEGGSLTNGTLVGQNTKLINESGDESLIGVNLRGSWKRPDAHVTADEEDLTINNHNQMQLANKMYDEEAFSGMGRVYLRKNIVDGKNILDETMMSEPNTIYIIQYGFELDGETLEVPENCVLKFEGGSLGNGTLIGQNTAIDAGIVKIFETDVTISGSWNVAEAYPEWFGAKGDGVSDDTISISKCVSYFRRIKFKDAAIYLINGVKIGDDYTAYLRDGNIFIPSNTIIDLNNSTLKLIPNTEERYNILFSKDTTNIVIKNGNIIGDSQNHIFGEGTNEWGYGISIQGCNNVVIDNVKISYCIGDGINLQDSFVIIDNVLTFKQGNFNISIFNCCIKHSGRNNISVESGDLVTIDNCVLSFAERVAPKANIDIEPSITTGNVSNVSVSNCKMTDSYYGVNLHNVGNNNIIKNVTITNCFSVDDIPIQCNKVMGAVLVNGLESNSIIYVYDTSSISIVNSHFQGVHNKSSQIKIDNSKFVYITLHTDGTFTIENSIIKNNSNSNLIELPNVASTLNIVNSILDLSESNNDRVRYIISHNDAATINLNGCTLLGKEQIACSVGKYTSLKDCILDSVCVNVGDGAVIKQCTINNCPDSSYHSVFTFVNNINYALINENIINSVGQGVQYLLGKYGSNTMSRVSFYGNVIIPEIQVATTTVQNTKAVLFEVGITTNRPGNPIVGFKYFDTTLGKPIWWKGTAWVESDGAAAGVLRSGQSANRPTAAGIYAGFQYFDTTLGAMITWNGSYWVNENGFHAAAVRGELADRPTSELTAVDEGYQYYATDVHKAVYFSYNGGSPKWYYADGTDVQ